MTSYCLTQQEKVNETNDTQDGGDDDGGWAEVKSKKTKKAEAAGASADMRADGQQQYRYRLYGLIQVT